MSSLNNKYFTIMVVPHSEKTSCSFKVPIYFVKLASILFVVSIILLLIFAYNYHGMVKESKELKELRKINAKQSEKIDEFAKETKELESKLAMLAHTEYKIRQLTELEELERQDIKGFEFEEVNLKERLDHISLDEQVKLLQQETYLPLGNSADEADSTLEKTKENIRALSSKIPEQQKRFEDAKTSLEEKEEKRRHTPDTWPLKGRVSSPFGYRNSPITGIREFHKGIDIAANYNTPVKAAAEGRVEYASYRSGSGNLLIIDHGYGYKTHYAHLSSFNVSIGEEVNKGEIIGYVGSTGRSTGPHLHYEIHVNNEPINPKEYLP